MHYSEHQHPYLISSNSCFFRSSKPTFRKKKSRCIDPLNYITGENHLPEMQFWAKGGQRCSSHIKHPVKYQPSRQELHDHLQLDFS